MVQGYYVPPETEECFHERFSTLDRASHCADADGCIGLGLRLAYRQAPFRRCPQHHRARDFPCHDDAGASRDHTLFGPMYTDYEDLTGSGRVDPTYRSDLSTTATLIPAKCWQP